MMEGRGAAAAPATPAPQSPQQQEQQAPWYQPPLQKISIYQTRARVYLVGFDKARKAYSLLRLSRGHEQGHELDAVEVR